MTYPACPEPCRTPSGITFPEKIYLKASIPDYHWLLYQNWFHDHQQLVYKKTPFYSIFSNCEHWAFSWNMSTTSLLFAYLCLTKTKHRNPWNPCHLVVFFGPTGSTRWIPTGFDSLKIQHRSDAIRLALLVPWRPKWRYFEKSDVHRKAVFLLWGVSGWEFVNISWTFHIWTY